MGSEHAFGRLVLVVDDDPDILQTLALCLSTEGYRVLMAANGSEALDLVGKEKPACILLDLMMPVMDGWQFRAAQLADPALAEIPVVIISATDAGEVPADARVPKPIDVDALLATVSRLATRT
jgi:CheY-like chemotaxis protein